MAGFRACSLEGDVSVILDTWRDRLLRKLGPEFKIENGHNREMLVKRCEVLLWDTPQSGNIEVAFVFHNFLQDIPDNTNPVLTTHSAEDKRRLEALLSNRWKVVVKRVKTNE